MNAGNSEIQPVAGSMKVMGIITLIFGMLAIAMPWITGQSVLMLIGILVIAGGLTRMFWAFRAGSLGRGILVFLIGILTLLAGIAIISHPVLASGMLTILLAVYFFADGFAELIAAFALPSGQAGKGWLMFDGIVTMVLGGLLWSGFPLVGTLAIGVFLGIKLIFVGLSMFALGKVASKVAA